MTIQELIDILCREKGLSKSESKKVVNRSFKASQTHRQKGAGWK